MPKYITILSAILVILLSVFSYGYVDLNLTLSGSPVYTAVHGILSPLVYGNRPAATLIYTAFLLGFYFLYIRILGSTVVTPDSKARRSIMTVIAIVCLFVFAYPAVSYDLFNYITTAKVAFFHGENPYIIMPTDIPSEPFLSFTRAANKTALYGPVWILLTSIPWTASGGNILTAIITFKTVIAVSYILFLILILRRTSSWRNVVYFAFNPLILMESLLSGHNDLVMMLLAFYGISLIYSEILTRKIAGIVIVVMSWFVKGATLCLFPLLWVRKFSFERVIYMSYWLLLAIFVFAAPIREELYPWYAVWIVSAVSLLPMEKYPHLFTFTAVFSFGLELRHLPYMWMGYYEGPGPAIRMIVTAAPVFAYLLWLYITRENKKYS